MSKQPAIIIDNGSSTVKVGYGGEEAPRTIIPTCVALERGPITADSPIYVGKEALKKVQKADGTGLMTLKYPIQRGTFMDWDQMEEIWDYAFEEIQAKPEMHPVVLTANAYTPPKHRETLAEIFFETFKVPQLYVAMPGYLTLYASGDNTGIVVESGEGVTHIVPIIDGVILPNSSFRLPVAGKDITDSLIKLLLGRGYTFEPSQEQKIARHIKHNMCYVCYDFDDELIGAKQNPSKFEQNLELHTGENVVLADEAFRACEILFEPSLVGCEEKGLPSKIHECIEKFDVSLRKKLYGNIVLGGGNMLFPGMSERITKNLKELTSQQKNLEIRVHANTHQYSAWQGASVLTCLPEFEKLWVTQTDYINEGPSLILKRCF